LWYALARPDRVRRLVLLGAAPLLPGTRPPPVMRVMATPRLGAFLQRMAKPGPKMVAQFMAVMGEGSTVVNYPDLVDSLIAGQKDRVASDANRAELQAIMTLFGFRREVRIRPEELRRLAVPTLLVWGNHDPVGDVEVARTVASLIPNARLEILPAGHVPYLGNPDRTAELVSSFVR
jgi:pimeloyl-ACP methyl ester carboxylesterase